MQMLAPVQRLQVIRKCDRGSDEWHYDSPIFFILLLSKKFSLKVSFFCDSTGNRKGWVMERELKKQGKIFQHLM
jgi:hypothetical protein